MTTPPLIKYLRQSISLAETEDELCDLEHELVDRIAVGHRELRAQLYPLLDMVRARLDGKA